LFGDDFHQRRNVGKSDAIDRVGVTDPFFELGGDSVLAGQVLAQLSRTVGVTLDSARAFEDFTVENLARLAEAAMIDAIEEISDADAAEVLGVDAPPPLPVGT
jgi:Phosphopantetheine attachment site